jgi:spermidine/putrescine transport system substrate-binding protein
VAGSAAAIVVVALALAVMGTQVASNAQGTIGGTLNIIVWPGYEEDQIVKPFEQRYGVKVNSKTVSSSDQMFAILAGSQPGEWDVASPDTPWIEKLAKAGLVQPLDATDYPEVAHFFQRWQRFDQLYADGQLYGVVSRFGFYGIVYNSQYVNPLDTHSIKVMWNPKYKGKIVIYDWYLPNMGMIGRYLGFAQPYEVAGASFQKLVDALYSLRPQVGIIAATNADTIQALANGSAWLSFGGEWLQVLLKEQGRPIELTIPDEGGVSWTESLVILKNSRNPRAAKAYIQHVISPEFQARLAWANAFHAIVPNRLAQKYLTARQATMLYLDNPARLDRILNTRIATREIPRNEDEWKHAWEEFKSR